MVTASNCSSEAVHLQASGSLAKNHYETVRSRIPPTVLAGAYLSLGVGN